MTEVNINAQNIKTLASHLEGERFLSHDLKVGHNGQLHEIKMGSITEKCFTLINRHFGSEDVAPQEFDRIYQAYEDYVTTAENKIPNMETIVKFPNSKKAS